MAITDKGDNTGNIFIDVLAAYSFLDVGGDRNITYYFEQGGNTSPHNWSLSDKVSWQIALLAWADVANITVQEVFSPDADLREAWVSSDFMTASHGLGPDGVPLVSYHRLPQISSGSFNGEYNRGYTGTVNQPPHWGPSGPAVGSSGFWIFVQTIGQGLGLTPPFGTDQLANEPLFPGVTDAGDLGDFGYNQMVYTVLSPNPGQYISAALNYGYPVTPMAFDIAAIQFLYGPNTTFQSGSDGYGLPDENAAGTVWRCIWDTGGTDTISYGGKKNATIDLRPASLVFGDPIAGGAISKVDGIFGGFTIANGVVIENASGGSGNDTIRGNSADNVIDGKAGDDAVIYSGARSAYTITDLGGNTVRVTGPDGSDTISNVERLVFSDATVTLATSPAPSPAPSGGSLSAWASAGMGDFNGDGRSDVLLQHANGFVAEWQMNGNQILSNLGVAAPSAQWHVAGLGDFNADNRDDILMQHDNGFVALWQMNGNQIVSNLAVANPGPQWHIAGAGDFNGDGFADALVRHDNGFLSLWQMVGNQITANLGIANPGPQWHVAGTGDFDGDGRSDILMRHDNGQVVLWQMNGNQIVSNLGVATPGPQWHVAGVGDFGGDGRADVLMRHDNGFVALWQMNGNQIVSNLGVGDPGAQWHVVAVGDYDGDNLSDTLLEHDNGFVALWDMTGAHIDANLGVATIGSEWKIVPPSHELS